MQNSDDELSDDESIDPDMARNWLASGQQDAHALEMHEIQRLQEAEEAEAASLNGHHRLMQNGRSFDAANATSDDDDSESACEDGNLPPNGRVQRTRRNQSSDNDEPYSGASSPYNQTAQQQLAQQTTRQALPDTQKYYPTFDPNILQASFNNAFDVKPLDLSTDETWTVLDGEDMEMMKPERAMCVNVPIDMFHANAEFLMDLNMPAKRGEHDMRGKAKQDRIKACSRIISLLFAGTEAGVPTGNSSEKVDDSPDEGRRDDESTAGGDGSSSKNSIPLKNMERYTFRDKHKHEKLHPMFQIGYEEIYSLDLTKVTFIRIWIFVFDPMFSTSYLVSNRIAENRIMRETNSAKGTTVHNRSVKHVQENSKRDAANLNLDHMQNTVAHHTFSSQHLFIYSHDEYVQQLKLFGGSIDKRFFIAGGDKGFKQHIQHMKRDTVSGVPKKAEGKLRGVGSVHPLAPEFVFNAKRVESLAFGLNDLDGELGDVHPDYYDTRSYWCADGETFRLPDIRNYMCVCGKLDVRGIAELKFHRKLATVHPRRALLQVFVEMHMPELASKVMMEANPVEKQLQSARDAEMGTPSELDGAALSSRKKTLEEIEKGMDSLLYKNEILTKFACFTTGSLSSSVVSSEGLTSTSSSAAPTDSLTGKGKSNDQDQKESSGGMENKTIEPTTTIALHTNYLHEHLVKPWYEQASKALNEEADGLIENGTFKTHDDVNQHLRIVRALLQVRYAAVVRDLSVFHLERVYSCFETAADRENLPPGWIAVFDQLNESISKNGNSLSMAWGALSYKDGHPSQLSSNDKTVWHSLTEWLHTVMGDDCLIEGRDIHVMDHTLLQYFECFTPTASILLLCSPRGAGKSVRIDRFRSIMPPGTTSTMNTTTDKADFNGGVSAPENGTLEVRDEMSADLSSSGQDPAAQAKLEVWKLKCTNREYTHKRTQKAANGEFKSVNITTGYHSAYLVLTNMGSNFTLPNESISETKGALLSRTHALALRTESTEASSASDFESKQKQVEVARRREVFRLMVCITAFLRIAIKGVSLLAPEMGFAKMLHAQADKMMRDEYGYGSNNQGVARRNGKRTETCITQSIMESVARVFLYAQTSLEFEAGKPIPKQVDNGKGGMKTVYKPQEFKVEQLYDALRIAMNPTRDVIRDSWYKSLYYNLPTTPQGVNVTSTLCESVGFQIENLFRDAPVEAFVDTHTLQNDDLMCCGMFHKTILDPDKGVDISSLDQRSKYMKETRLVRQKFRWNAVSAVVSNAKTAVDAIQTVVGEHSLKECTNALMPTFQTASIHYLEKSILSWSLDKAVEANDPAVTTVVYKRRGDAATLVERRPANQDVDQPFTARNIGASANKYDFAWMPIKALPQTCTRAHASKTLQQIDGPTKAFGYHDLLIGDVVLGLASADHPCICPEMPDAHRHSDIANIQAYVDDLSGDYVSDESGAVKVRPFIDERSDSRVAAVDAAQLDCRLDDDPHHPLKFPCQKELDILVNHGRLPALAPYTSTVIKEQSILQEVSHGGNAFSWYINVVRAWEHQRMIIEASLAATMVPGLRNRQEVFILRETNRCPSVFLASNAQTASTDVPSKTMVTRMPYSVDILQMHWAVDFSQRFYIDAEYLEDQIHYINTDLDNMEYLFQQQTHDPWRRMVSKDDVPFQHIPAQGFPEHLADRAKLKQIAIKQRFAPTIEATVENSLLLVEGVDMDHVGLYEIDAVRQEMFDGLSRRPTDAEVEAELSRRQNPISSYGTKGDILSYRTWASYASKMMTARGFCTGAFVAGDFSSDDTPNVEIEDVVHDLYWERRACISFDAGDDKGLACLLDAELMFIARRHEKRAVARKEEYLMGIDGKLGPSTYAGIEAEQERTKDLPPRSRSLLGSLSSSAGASSSRSADKARILPTVREYDHEFRSRSGIREFNPYSDLERREDRKRQKTAQPLVLDARMEDD